MQADLLRIFSLIDLTSLNDTDDFSTIKTLCTKAILPVGHAAALCVNPNLVKEAAQLLANTPVKIATVANFPQGLDSLEHAKKSMQKSMEDGADEIDVVFPYTDYLKGNQEQSYEFIRECRAFCKNKTLKVILETGALQDPHLILDVSDHLCELGVDFLKTSTGKISIGATFPAAEAMLKSIQKSSKPVGLKVSGGIRTIQQALQYIELAERMMGSQWITPAHFRIGASQLVDQLITAFEL